MMTIFDRQKKNITFLEGHKGKFLQHGFREKDFLNFSQSESIIGPRRHIWL